MNNHVMGIIIYGAGGHGKVVADALERQAAYMLLGFLDDNPAVWGKELSSYKIFGGMDACTNAGLARYPFIVAIGDNHARRQIVARLESLGGHFGRAVHPSAQIAKDVQLAPGVMIMANVVINPGSRIGNHTIVNTSATIDHDCVIGDFVHISPVAALAGNVVVREGAHIGMGSLILPGVQVGAYAIIGAGAVVVDDIPEGVTAVGVPARPIKKS
jgi:sugar O-acyltransferase (sialic acid O-acetyltransferase NeuD family)